MDRWRRLAGKIGVALIGGTVALAASVLGLWHNGASCPGIALALADSFPHPDVFLQGADGAHHTGCWEGSGSIPAELTNHINYLNGKGYNMQITVEATCATGITDARWADNKFVDLGLEGQTLCAQVGGAFGATVSSLDDECDSWTVRMKQGTICNKQTLWCHETGHSMGLGHQAGNCLNASCNQSTTYSADHLAHIQSY